MSISSDDSGTEPLKPPQPAKSPPDQIILAIRCHWCGHKGSSLWEKTATGRQRLTLDGFYERIAKKQPHDIETVCNNCDKPQPL